MADIKSGRRPRILQLSNEEEDESRTAVELVPCQWLCVEGAEREERAHSCLGAAAALQAREEKLPQRRCGGVQKASARAFAAGSEPAASRQRGMGVHMQSGHTTSGQHERKREEEKEETLLVRRV